MNRRKFLSLVGTGVIALPIVAGGLGEEPINRRKYISKDFIREMRKYQHAMDMENAVWFGSPHWTKRQLNAIKQRKD
jgi:hypothetical protein